MFQYPQNKTSVWSKSILRGWRYSSAIKNIDCSTKGPNLHFRFRAPDTVVQFPQALPAVYTQMYMQSKISIQMKQNKNKSFQKGICQHQLNQEYCQKHQKVRLIGP